MKADLAKVLFEIEGRTLLDHVLASVDAAGFDRTVIVVGHQHEQVRAAMAGRNVEFALQEPQMGTGHAAQCAVEVLGEFDGDVAVLAGDAPLIRARTLDAMMRGHEEAGATVTVLSARLPDPTGYGRVVRDAGGRVTAIVEHRDATPEQRAVDEINSSIYAFRYPFLIEALPRLRAENEQLEYYLTDTVAMAFAAGLPVEGVVVEDWVEVMGINTREQLDEARDILRSREP